MWRISDGAYLKNYIYDWDIRNARELHRSRSLNKNVNRFNHQVTSWAAYHITSIEKLHCNKGLTCTRSFKKKKKMNWSIFCNQIRMIDDQSIIIADTHHPRSEIPLWDSDYKENGVKHDDEESILWTTAPEGGEFYIVTLNISPQRYNRVESINR